MGKRFIIKESTRNRCKVFKLSDERRTHFQPISLELFHFLYKAQTIDFSIYIRVADEMIEYIKATELSQELLRHIWLASMKEEAEVEICVLKKDHPKFTRVINTVRDSKIKVLVEKHPALDRKTLQVFNDLSGASQMVLRGGLNKSVAAQVKAAASYMVSNLMENDFAMSTLSKMITIDPTLYDHSASVAMFGGIMAKQYLKEKIGTKQTEIIAQCGLYHDAGKACIPNSILNKPGSFTEEEFEVMKTHAVLGYKDLTKAIENGSPIDDVVARVALEHHERFTGHGYPHGLKGRYEEDEKNGIHVYARIIAIADSYSALLMERVYKPALPAKKAIELLEQNAMNHFDPDIFLPFIDSMKRSLQLLSEREKNMHGQIYVVEEGENTASKIKETQKKNMPLSTEKHSHSCSHHKPVIKKTPS
ncbi:HD domain-containing protein [bacterium]|nr:HD domain-containing protein [bacterium]